MIGTRRMGAEQVLSQLGGETAEMACALQTTKVGSKMSAVLQFPGNRAATRGAQRARSAFGAGAPHPLSGGSVISWVRPLSCECCGRPTLGARSRRSDGTLCGHCSPPNVA